MSKKKETIHKCLKCGRGFDTPHGLRVHERRMHPYIPPPPPKKTTFYANNGLPVVHKLQGAVGKLDIGDVFYRVEKLVVKRITITEGDDTLEVEAEVTKSNWQHNRP